MGCWDGAGTETIDMTELRLWSSRSTVRSDVRGTFPLADRTREVATPFCPGRATTSDATGQGDEVLPQPHKQLLDLPGLGLRPANAQ